jgi:hypothetical protein
MEKIAFVILVFFISSCSKENMIEQSTGTKLISIEYTDDDKNWLENYYYSNDGKLEEVQNLYSLGRRYEIEYEHERIKEYSTYRIDENKLVFRDSIIYNLNGTIRAIHNFSINSGEDLPLTWIYEYEYDSEKKITKKSTYFVTIQEFTSIEKYYWSGNNIERVEYCNEDEELYYEYFYKYDDKLNYKKATPTSISDPINWSDNNVTEVNWNDYLGNLDLICRPCITEYKYNLDNYPVSVEFNWGRKLKLTYE